jgi:hypothetical protein
MKSADLDLIEGLEKRLKGLEPLLKLLEGVKPEQFIAASTSIAEDATKVKRNQVILGEMIKEVKELTGRIEKIKIPEEIKGIIAHQHTTVYDITKSEKVVKMIRFIFVFGLIYITMIGGSTLIINNYLVNTKNAKIDELNVKIKHLDSLNKLNRKCKLNCVSY